MRMQAGFTLIELVLFIIITSILASAILLAYVGSLSNMPTIPQNTIATQTARQCAEWVLGQRRLNGYAGVSGANCTSPISLPGVCTVPSGYTLTVDCSATTLRSDTNYVTYTFAVTGDGNASITLLLGNY